MSGDIQISSNLILKNVLFVSQFHFNLLSVSALVVDSNLIVSFFPDYFLIQDQQNKKMIGKGDRREGLYVLHTNNVQAELSFDSNPVSQISVHTWHSRLGH